MIKRSLILIWNHSKPLEQVMDYRRPVKPIFIEIAKFWAWRDNLGRQITSAGCLTLKCAINGPEAWKDH